MKKKKNIIKKIELNKVFKLFSKKGFKHYFKEARLKDKFFIKVSKYYKSFFKLNILSKYYKYNILNINKNFLIKKSSYFGYISNGLDLKYNENISIDNYNYITSFNKKKSIYLSDNHLEIIKYQKFITFLSNNYVLTEKFDLNYNDYFNTSNFLFYSVLANQYNLNYLLLIFKCF